ncbi:MAG: N-acetylmuramoyl-L-alanine amidase [Bryobacteraceae bacterium]
MANEHNADLFLSIHANSSPVRSVSRLESYYLNFTTSQDRARSRCAGKRYLAKLDFRSATGASEDRLEG